MKYIPEEQLREICSEVNGTFALYVSKALYDSLIVL